VQPEAGSQGAQFAMGLHPNNNGTRRGQSVLEYAPHCSAMAPPLSLRKPGQARAVHGNSKRSSVSDLLQPTDLAV